jgi:hypothetical protein
VEGSVEQQLLLREARVWGVAQCLTT